MKILGLITARGGSKRLPGKNIRNLCEKPLIEWSIDVAKDIADICDILVTTDDSDIADVARKAGALVPWLRPAELATDEASSVDVSLHALDWYESEKGKVDGLLLLQPTSPFRTHDTVLEGIEIFHKHQYQTVIGVSPVKDHPLWCFKVDEGIIRPFIDENGEHLRSQDLPKAYVTNGAFYLISPDALRSSQSFYSGNMLPLIIDNPKESLDIDTKWDWEIAEMICKSSTSAL